MCAPEEKMIMQRFLVYVGKQDNLAIYGLDSVLSALKNGEVEAALVTDNSDITEIIARCKKCGQSKVEIVTKKMKTQILQNDSNQCRNAMQLFVAEKNI
jgi:peptide subunit release factor 1 (eRF1)